MDASCQGTDRAAGAGIATADGLALLGTMLRIRAFEEEVVTAIGDGDIPGVAHLSIGQEAVAAGVCGALSREDYVTSTHRGHGHCLAKGADAQAMMAELMGRAGGTCRGKGGSMHVADFSVGVLGANGVVGGGIGIAVGAAQASRLLGKTRVAACFFGDGAVNRGPFLEGLNWACVFRLPVLFICEDNGFAAFSRPANTTAGPGAAARAQAIGVTATSVDGNDAAAVFGAARALAERCRAGNGPALLYAPTYRLNGHTHADAAPYRDATELQRQRALDPLPRLRAALARQGCRAADLDAIAAAAAEEMRRARRAAAAMPWPDAAAALEDVQSLGAPTWPQ
jgi:pyruvate dehydrogenase E1 component alpha subunit